jgi:hypothetical protein
MPARRFAFHLAHRRLADIECCLHMENHIVDMAFRQLVIPRPRRRRCAVRRKVHRIARTDSKLRAEHRAAWVYQFGNRSGLEWVLDQWKEHKIGDPTVAEKFNNYRFAEHKEQVIALLQLVCTVSVETMKIVKAMP